MAFSLSQDEKRRIEEEEAARIAEENYREEVRRSMRTSGLSAKNPERLPPLRYTERVRLGWGLPICLVLAALLGGTWIFSAHSRAGAAESRRISDSSSLLSRWVEVTVPLVHGQFQVPAQKYLPWTLVVPGGNVRNYHVTGHFSAMGGGKDIQAVIATEDDFQNRINGYQARVFYSTPGRVTNGNIDVVLPAGRYVIAFNNRFSLLTPKAVFAEINATYEQMQ